METGLIEKKTGTSTQVVIPKSPQQRVLSLCHDPISAALPGGRKMYKTLRENCYWPGLAVDCSNYVRNCHECAKERVRIRKQTRPMKLFPASSSLDDVSMDLIRPLLKTTDGNNYLLVITDRYTKLVRAIPLRNTTAPAVAKAITRDWVFTYGLSRRILTDNGPDSDQDSC